MLQELVPLTGTETSTYLEAILAEKGGDMLAESISQIAHETAKPYAQDHKHATFTKKIKKEDGLIDIHDDAVKNWRKFRAYHSWPGTYFFVTKKNGSQVRVVIKEATYVDNVFTIVRVTPEGKKEMLYQDFLRGI